MEKDKEKKKKKDPLKEIMELLDEYDQGTPPRKMESCCAHGDHNHEQDPEDAN